jgi:hypothetical protein
VNKCTDVNPPGSRNKLGRKGSSGPLDYRCLAAPQPRVVCRKIMHVMDSPQFSGSQRRNAVLHAERPQFIARVEAPWLAPKMSL